MEKYVNAKKNIEIYAAKIEIGKEVSFGRDIRVKVNGTFALGDYSRLGGDTEILGNNIVFGSHLFHSSGLRVGGGGRDNVTANLTIGDRCTIHNNFLNVCEPIAIGDDVGLSTEVSILTHGYWLSVLDGYPASFSGVQIGSGVIVGYRSVIMMGAVVPDRSVIGAQSVVTKELNQTGVYAGSPARFIKLITPLTYEQRVIKTNEIIEKYKRFSSTRGIDSRESLVLDFPMLRFKEFVINVETFEYYGVETDETDDLRDYLRKWGIRVYTKRPFKSNQLIDSEIQF